MRTVAGLLLAATLLTGCQRPAADAGGREIFLEVCAGCHGNDLGGGVGPALGPGSTAATRDDEFLYDTIRNGRGRMPSFSHTLSEQQIERVVGYLREVQGGR